MRVLLATPSEDARLYNVVPLGWALRSAGHEVQVACRAGFAETVNRTGLVAVAAGEDSGGDEGWLADERATDALVDYARLWNPDLVIWDQRAPAGSAAAAAVGAASVRMRGVHDHAAPTPEKTPGGGHLTLDTTPPSLRTRPRDDSLPVRYIPYDGPTIVPSWLRRRPRRPRVHVCVDDAAALLPGVFDAVSGLDVEVTCATVVDRLPSGVGLPDNVRLFDRLSLNVVLPTCSAVVHDGTASVAAQAHGVPQLVLTSAGVEDHAPLAKRIDHLVFDPASRAQAERLRAELQAMPSPREVVPKLVGLVRGELGVGRVGPSR